MIFSYLLGTKYTERVLSLSSLLLFHRFLSDGSAPFANLSQAVLEAK